MILDKPVEDANAPAGPPARDERLLLPVLPGDARNIEMRPRRLLDEALEKLRRTDRARVRADGVLHICDLRTDQLVVARAKRKPPHRFTNFFSRFEDTSRQFVVIGEEPGMLLTERHH